MPTETTWRRARSLAGYLPRLFTTPLPRTRPFSEMGVAGTPVYAGYVLTPERHPKMVGQEKYRTFSDMLSNTSIIAAGTRYFLNVIAKPAWTCETDSDKPDSKRYGEFVDDVLENLHTPWSRIVRRAGTYRFHGFSIQEWTAMRRDDGYIGFYDIESRPQWTIWRWEVDERGTVIGAWQRDPLTGRELGLPRGKLMYIVDDTINDSPEGLGLFRHMVEPTERLKEYLDLEKVGFDRDLRGIPIGRAPMRELNSDVQQGVISEATKENAVNELKKFVQMEKRAKTTSLVLPSDRYISRTDTGDMITNEKKWEVETITGTAPGLPDIHNAIQRLNEEMARILGVEHLLLGSGRGMGSYALSKDKSSAMYLLANSVLRDICLQVENDIVKPLWALNGFPEEAMPHLKTEDVVPKDAEQISEVLRNMATAGAIIAPDDEVQNFVRDLLGAPHVDLDKLAAEDAQQQAVSAQSSGINIQQKQQGMNQQMAAAAAQTAARHEDQQDKQDQKEQDGTYYPTAPVGMQKDWSDAARAASLEVRRMHQKIKGFINDEQGLIHTDVVHFLTHHGLNVANKMMMSSAVSAVMANMMPGSGMTGKIAGAVAGYAAAELAKKYGLTLGNAKDLLVHTSSNMLNRALDRAAGLGALKRLHKVEVDQDIIAWLREVVAAFQAIDVTAVPIGKVDSALWESFESGKLRARFGGEMHDFVLKFVYSPSYVDLPRSERVRMGLRAWYGLDDDQIVPPAATNGHVVYAP